MESSRSRLTGLLLVLIVSVLGWLAIGAVVKAGAERIGKRISADNTELSLVYKDLR